MDLVGKRSDYSEVVRIRGKYGREETNQKDVHRETDGIKGRDIQERMWKERAMEPLVFRRVKGDYE